MPVYLCTAGAEEEEPWKHGIQVFAKPFPIPDDAVVVDGEHERLAPLLLDRSVGTPEPIHLENTTTTNSSIRKVMHAQVVLVDDVCISYGRYWVRLRWPGNKGGFAGYIAMQKVGEDDDDNDGRVSDAEDEHLSSQRQGYATSSADEEDGETTTMDVASSTITSKPMIAQISSDGGIPDEYASDGPEDETSSEPLEEFRRFICQRTNLNFPTSGIFQLLHVYDDGIRTALPPFPTENVFCRICREGLHDDAEELPAAAKDDVAEGVKRPKRYRNSNNNNMTDIMDDDICDDIYDDSTTMDPPPQRIDQGPVRPHPVYSPHTEVIENPMLAPCQCSGSMAFVHYMCVEQWRCRSRHPTAANGMNCETCGAKYALPPPSATHQPVDEPAEWQDAMPPHVMNALRQPHIWWQIGAAIVRRRWLRPAAPIVMSPIVALYCRARRLLKKRGVARRRWACSLCRRRARWKCVRCLRSYYCSRQCQNVAWHIIHKHVCYKPSRLYGSVVFYGIAALLLMPGILKDPLWYDLSFLLIPASFIVVSVIVGGLATLMKKTGGVDTRGRRLELAVVILTIGLSVISLGLLSGFFGQPNYCYGVAGQYHVTASDVSSTFLLRMLRQYVFLPCEFMYRAIDSSAYRTLKWTRLCTADPSNITFNDRCFTHLGNANASFFIENDRCAADMLLVGFLYLTALMFYVGNGIHKHLERRQRRRRHFHVD